jgi:DNA helicase II / ATP-dependent DNA helicase PcrA
MQCVSRITVSVAGSGKTTSIAESVLAERGKHMALVTYTINGCDNLYRCCNELAGGFCTGVRIQSWYSFVLANFIRPYQNFLYGPRIDGITFDFVPEELRRVKKLDTARYYFSSPGRIWRDRVTDFACSIIERSGGLSIDRIKSIYGQIVIDEAQDLAGWDLELVEALLHSGVQLRLVGDPRQATYSTNYGQKNSQFRGAAILNKFQEWGRAGLVEIEQSNRSFRCVRQICDFANLICDGSLEMVSGNSNVTEHDGVFLIEESQAVAYHARYSPQVLRYDRTFDVPFGTPMNFGESKGLTFDRVLVVPHGPLEGYLRTGEVSHLAKSRDKVYVAVTRARQSVAFLVPDGFTSPVVAKYSE